MSIGKGIAIVGIWIGVAACSFNIGAWTIVVAALAAGTTCVIAVDWK